MSDKPLSTPSNKVAAFPKKRRFNPAEEDEEVIVFHDCGEESTTRSYRFSIWLNLDTLLESGIVCSGCGHRSTLRQIMEAAIVEEDESV